MENLKAIKNRIKTVDSIIKATNAMKMVSSIKLTHVNNVNRFAKEGAKALFDMFSRAVDEILFKQEFDGTPWFCMEDGATLLIILSTDQGFCGSFKQLILDEAQETVAQHPGAYVETFGKKAQHLTNVNPDLQAVRNVQSRYDISAFADMLSQLVWGYVRSCPIKEILVVSGEFKNVVVQKAQCQKIFTARAGLDFHEAATSQYTEIEGSQLGVVGFAGEVFKAYLSKLFTGIVTEHLLSELSARVMAMDNSVRNARGMFDKLSALYNRVRQAKITQELTEIVSSIECVQ